MDTMANKRCEFNEKTLPWLAALAVLIIYTVTLNHWVTTASIGNVAKIVQWDSWSLTLQAPLFYIITYPIRWLPGSWQILVLNFFSAICAAAALALLAKSVALLPHDRTRDQRIRERSDYSLLSIPTAWIPPVLAVLACGLQLTWWENATASTGEALNALLFAYVVCSLLQFRIKQEDGYLFKSALVYGLAITNNWAMVAFLPLYLVAMVWMKGVAFFNGRFFMRMFFLGCAGLLLYLALPLMDIFSAKSGVSFWQLIKTEIGMQKNALLIFPRYVLLLCAVSSVLPVFAMGFRFPSTVGDTSIVGNILTTVMFRVMHIFFLGLCLWVMFDPPFSPRVRGFGLPFLPLYFLSALGVGYFSGYFLLVFGSEPEKRRHASQPGTRLLGQILAGLVLLALVVVPASLVYKNLTSIRTTNGPGLYQLAQAMTESLPAKDAYVLSDDPMYLFLIQAALQRSGTANTHIFVDTRSLYYKSYHHLLHNRYGERWSDVLTGERFSDPISAVNVHLFTASQARTGEVFFAHPPFNYFSEGLYAEPKGLIYRMKPYPSGQVLPPPLSADTVTANQTFWNRIKGTFPRGKAVQEGDIAQPDTQFVSFFLSRAANVWGVELQKNNNLPAAAQAFALALQFNPENEVAFVNQRYNQILVSGQIRAVELDPAFDEKMRQKYRRWTDLLRLNGPFDEPRFCMQWGENFALSDPPFIRLSTLQFLRVLTFEPGNLEASVWLANMYLKCHLPDRTLEVVKNTRQQTNAPALSLANQHELERLEAWAFTFKTNMPQAIKILQEAQRRDPGEPSLPETLAQIYLQAGDFTNSLSALDQQLKLDPNNMKALFNHGALCIQLKRYPQAVASLTRVLESEPKNEAARLNRAIANLQNGHLDDAERDYETLLKFMPDYYRAFYGLGEIARQRKDIPAATRYFEQYMKFGPSNTSETKKVSELLNEMRRAK
jgi:tetratricopeptide (TPR) repeat protein